MEKRVDKQITPTGFHQDAISRWNNEGGATHAVPGKKSLTRLLLSFGNKVWNFLARGK